jgi:putative hydrolase of the HAD superfamily
LGIVSDAQNDYAIPELKILGIQNFFDSIVISGNHGFRKPDHRLFNECLRKIHVSPKEAVFVGNDVFRDIKGARSLGMKTILVTDKSTIKESEEERPDFTVKRIQDLPDMLHKVSNY